jgi:serpin B
LSKTFLAIAMAVLMIGLAACSPADNGGNVNDDGIPTDTDSSDLAVLVAGNNAFAFDLYHQLGAEDNLFCSPHSVSLALAMAYAGARAETEEAMAAALHFGLDQDELHAAFRALTEELASRGQGAQGKDGEGFRLNIVNDIWGQEDYDFLAQFLELLETDYGAELKELDFISAPEESRLTINDWISQQTEGRIEDLIAPGGIDPLTRLVLTNAIYFNAAWMFPFKVEATGDEPFYLLDGGEVSVSMMKQTEYFGYAEGDDYQVVTLPYDGGELSMLILLPEIDEFPDFESQLDAERLDAIIADLESQKVLLTMPKFEFRSSFGLKDALSAMGMADAFSGNADFSGMTGNYELFISDVIHQAFVSVDEAGTEAAAATAVIMPTSAPEPTEPIEVTIDSPFIFLIRDIETGAIVFLGRVLDPGS